ncbi:hypothetical protein JTB14_015259 [Gonioctena quinquepunctata]|nr:hypothetical protein JTB14_015259 [Gonioctena quinquepunctata]
MIEIVNQNKYQIVFMYASTTHPILNEFCDTGKKSTITQKYDEHPYQPAANNQAVDAAEKNNNNNIQAVAVQVDFPYKMTICNIYLSEYNWTLNDSIELVEQLPTPYLLPGDFNAHNQLWRSIRVDARGRVVKQFINDMGLVIMNNGDGIFFNSRSNNISAIDLTICSAEIAADFLWSSLSHHNGTDHFPVAIECADRLMNQNVPQRWRSEQANWTQYQDALSTFQLPYGTIDDTVKPFSDAILLATEKTVPQTGRTRRNKNVPWWNEEVA